MNTKTEELTEAQIVEAAQVGRLESFAALYQRYYSPMAALAYSILADSHLAEDAAQETFAIACRDLRSLKNKEKFAAWLAGICRNTARQMQRDKAKVIPLNEAAANSSNMDTTLELDSIRQAVWKLRACDRELIILRYYDNLPYDRIASVLAISPQAVNGRLIRAKRKIEKFLKHNGFTGGDYEHARK